MRVGAAETKSADRSSPSLVVFNSPFFQLSIDIERIGFEINRGITVLEMQRWRDAAMFQRQQEFQHTGHAGGGPGMTDIGFHCANCAELLFIRVFPEGAT